MKQTVSYHYTAPLGRLNSFQRAFFYLAGGLVLLAFMWNIVVLNGLIGMTIMMLIGMWDDMKDISALLRFIIEIVLVGAFILITDTYIDDLHGLWGIHKLDPLFGMPLSVVAGVGIINSVNLIDGVDGYSSGYGMLMAVFVFFAMSSNQKCDELAGHGVGLCAYTLAVLCIPVFDTLRVMSMRMLRGISPFHPDKTHLHHLFIDMGFSHLGAALFILFMNLGVVLLWFLSWRLGASIDVQTYLVVGLGLLVTFGFYGFMKRQQNGGPVDDEGYPQGTRLWHVMRRLGGFTHREDRRFWRVMRHLMDEQLLCSKV